MINAYDFDNTIYDGDSTIDFYFYCLKRNYKIIFLIFIQLYGLLMYLLGIKDKDFLKEKFFCFLKYFDNIDDVVKDFWSIKDKKIKKWYLEVKKTNDVIISASPEFLLKPIAKKLNVSNLIATKVNPNTGKYESKDCSREEKVNRLKEKLGSKKINNFYSDSHSDDAMAKISKNAFYVKRNDISRWKFNKSNKKDKLKFLILFTIIFCFLFYFCIEMYYARHGKSYFRTFDGIDQHYLIFSYIGDLIRGLFSGNGFVFWNNGIGYGADVLTSLAAYLYDPFNWISVFFSNKNAEFGFNFMIFLKFYATGISFAIYCFYKKYDYKTILTGSLLYTFCSTMYIVFIESFFINPMYIFPILIIGCDKLLKKGNPIIYVLTLAFSFINYFYFGYMMCIFIFFYCLINCFCDSEIEKSIKNIINIALRFILYSIIAIGISMIVLLPVMSVLLSINRLDINYYLPFLYNKEYYTGILKGFINFYNMSERDAILGYGAVSLPCIISLFFIKDKKMNKYKIELVLLLLILVIPFLSTVFNGFSYYCNRWVWCLAFLVCNIVCISINNFSKISLKKYIKMFIIVLLYTLIVYIILKYKSQEFLVSSLLSMFIIIVIYFARKKDILLKNMFIILTVISLIVSSSYYFRGAYFNQTSYEVVRGSAYNSVYHKKGQELLYNIKDNNMLRYDDEGVNKIKNSSWIYNRSGIDHYISIYNNEVNVFNNEIGLVSSASSMDYRGLNRKSSLSYLMGVNYFIIKDGLEGRLPYYYTNKIDSIKYNDSSYSVYSPIKDASIIYGFDKVMNREDYIKLSAYDKMQAITSSIILDDVKTNYDFIQNQDIINYDIELGHNIKIDDTKYVVSEDDYISLSFKSIRDCEVYLNMNIINYEYELKSNYGINVETYYNHNKVDNLYSSFRGSNNKSHMFGNKNDYLLNLGYTNSPIDEIRIYFEKGKYDINNIVLYSLDKDRIEKKINGFDIIASNVKYNKNKITAELEALNDEYAFISVPYSNGGWSAYLDGKKVEIKKADTAFMAIELKKGKHNLVLKYKTPMLLEGIIISIVSIAVFIIILIKNNYFKR